MTQRKVCRPRLQRVIARATMMKMVMTATPTRDQVAVSYSMRGRGVGMGVVVTACERTIKLRGETHTIMWCNHRQAQALTQMSLSKVN